MVGRIVNVVAYYSQLEHSGKPLNEPEQRKATKEEVLAIFKEWEPEVLKLLNCIETPLCWAIQDLNPLESYIGSRTLILGDAAHAMAPHLGAGAGIALEDAYILGAIISATDCIPEDVPQILTTYDSIRRPFGNRSLLAARKQGMYYEMNTSEFQDIKYQGQTLTEGQVSTLVESIAANWSWATTPVDSDLSRAIEMATGAMHGRSGQGMNVSSV
ncbi:hypothetical protein V5O48_002292 [Marasmius crinis-equi]|uniref:FAD-binding domain-containing protein n=1 Tax=Marasmius crinis-equi TaxID=585013 RepID=A0ABR3FW28_9AGAR